jgi:hypothetical protein
MDEETVEHQVQFITESVTRAVHTKTEDAELPDYDYSMFTDSTSVDWIRRNFIVSFPF